MGLWRDLPREDREHRIAAARRRMREFDLRSTAGWRDLGDAVGAPVDALRRALDPAWAERRCARINAARGHARRIKPPPPGPGPGQAPAIVAAADAATIVRMVPNRWALGSNGPRSIAVTLPRLRCLE